VLTENYAPSYRRRQNQCPKRRTYDVFLNQASYEKVTLYSCCYATIARRNMRCLTTAGKHVNNTRAIDRRVGLTTLPSSVSRLSRQNVGSSTSHNPMGLLGLLQG
jgi:hypothetical protein